jgi:hypothetical protein
MGGGLQGVLCGKGRKPLIVPPTMLNVSFSALPEEEMDPRHVPGFIRHGRPINSWYVFHFSRHERASRHAKLSPDSVGSRSGAPDPTSPGGIRGFARKLPNF